MAQKSKAVKDLTIKVRPSACLCRAVGFIQQHAPGRQLLPYQALLQLDQRRCQTRLACPTPLLAVELSPGSHSRVPAL